MLEKTTIARPYAQAVFEIAAEEEALKSWSGLLQNLALAVADPDMAALLHNPRVSDDQLFEIISSLLDDTFSDSQQSFVRLLIEAGRLQFAPQIAELFEQHRLDAEGLARIDVISAYPLKDEQREKIAAVMAKRLGKEIELNTDTDKQLIGGAIIRCGDSVIDASVRGQLESLRSQLL